MTTALFIVGVVAVVSAANALRPLPLLVSAVPTFFAGWLTGELAPHLLVGLVITLAVLAGLGGASGLGLVGLGCGLVGAAGLGVLVVQSQRARGVLDQAVDTQLGADHTAAVAGRVPSGPDLRLARRQLLLPFVMRHPNVEIISDLVYDPQTGRRGRLDVYRNTEHPVGCPVLLYLHGGAWVIGNKEQQGKPLMLHLASRGWVCVTANYPLSPKATWPDQIVAAKRAMAWIRANITGYGGDPRFVAVSGGSAGGHLAAMLGLTAGETSLQPGFEDVDTSVQACVPSYGVYDIAGETGTRVVRLRRDRLLAKMVFKTTDPAVLRAGSPLDRVTADAPPFFIIHGAHDSLVPVAEAREFARRLRETTRADLVYAELPGTQHAFDVFPSVRTGHVVRAVERVLDVWVTRARAGAAQPPAAERD